MYDNSYYCAGCSKKLGTMSHDVIDRMGASAYEDRYCRPCEKEELAFLSSEEDDYDYPDDFGPPFCCDEDDEDDD